MLLPATYFYIICFFLFSLVLFLEVFFSKRVNLKSVVQNLLHIRLAFVSM